MRSKYDFAKNWQEAFYAQQQGGMGLFGGLVGGPESQLVTYQQYQALQNIAIPKKEDKMNLQLTRIDDHTVVDIGCIRRIVHNKKELKKLAEELIDKYVSDDATFKPMDAQYQRENVLTASAISCEAPSAKDLQVPASRK